MAGRNYTLYEKQSAVTDALSHLVKTQGEKADFPLGRCEILRCVEDAFELIDGILICSGHRSILDEMKVGNI